MAGPDPLLQDRAVLVVDDHAPTLNLLVNYLGSLGCRVSSASGGLPALEKMRAQSFDLVVLDLRMDDLDGLQVLERARAEGLAQSFIMMSAEGTIGHAVRAMRLGATDFLVKPFELDQLVALIHRAFGAAQGRDGGAPDPRLAWRDTFAPNLVGEHPSLLHVFLVLERIAQTDCTVLISGESGTGKELVARALHNASKRAKKPFVPVNCGAIPETLIESELFGHTKGAFSGATQARDGRFAVADEGTLFLDEIGEMALPVQVKFLRVLQEGEYVPVGEARPRKCDVRIVAATNRDLEQMASEGSFREDLFYRLNTIPVHLPPLRERRSDIPLLTRHFLDLLNRRRGRDIAGMTDEAMEIFCSYDWPGNVRELENTVERMTLLHQGGGVLGTHDLPPKLQRHGRQMHRGTSRAQEPDPRPDPTQDPTQDPKRGHEPDPAPPQPIVLHPEAAREEEPTGPAPNGAPTPTPAPNADPAPAAAPPEASSPQGWTRPEDFRLPPEGLNLRATLEAFEMSLIDQALARTGGNKNQASILLGMNRTTLVEKLRKRRRKQEAQGS